MCCATNSNSTKLLLPFRYPSQIPAQVLYGWLTRTEKCAGNRRHTMRTKVKEVDGLDWNDGAVCNCTWRGPLLADVLARARPTIALQDEQGRQGHVHFSCYQTDVQDDDYYGSSVPLARCLDRSKKVILALDVRLPTLPSPLPLS